jgi:hypothetical protein
VDSPRVLGRLIFDVSAFMFNLEIELWKLYLNLILLVTDSCVLFRDKFR